MWPFRKKLPGPAATLKAMSDLGPQPEPYDFQSWIIRARAMAEIAEANGDNDFAEQFRKQAADTERLILDNPYARAKLTARRENNEGR